MTLSSCTVNQDGTEWHVFAQCQSCQRGVVFRATGYASSNQLPEKMFSHQFHERLTIAAVWPNPPAPILVDKLPTNVATALSQAEASYLARLWPAAAVMYGKAVERALKDLDPEARGMLDARIRNLEKTQALPHGLIELLDRIKFLRNDGAHDDVDPDEIDVTRGRDFVRLFLTYVYELPSQIDDAKADRKLKQGRE